MKNTYCVYLHINKIDGKKYVGQTCQIPEKRWKEGKGYKGCVHFFNAIIKYGWDNFEHKIVYDSLTKEEADYFEDLMINSLNTTDCNYGYNIKNGGSIGKHSEESKIKMSKAKKGKYVGKKSYNYGRKHTEEARRHMSEAHLGLKPSKEAIEKLSKSLKGRIPWNKGIKTGPRSEETKKKLSEVNKGKKPSVTAIKASIEARKGKSPWNKGLTKETDERVAKYAKTKLKNKTGE